MGEPFKGLYSVEAISEDISCLTVFLVGSFLRKGQFVNHLCNVVCANKYVKFLIKGEKKRITALTFQ